MAVLLASFRQTIDSADTVGFITWMFLIWGGASAILAFALHCLHRISVIVDTPVSKIRSAAQGFVKISGRAEPYSENRMVAPLSNKPCVWWSYTVTDLSGSNNSPQYQGESSVHFVEKTSVNLLHINDDTGTCVIDPAFAEVIPAIRDVWYGKTSDPGNPCARAFASFKFVERRIHVGDTLHASGIFQSADGTPTAAQVNEAQRKLLAAWKHNQPELIRRFDTNHDGVVDMQEWDAAREAARQEVLAKLSAPQNHPPVDMLVQPDDGRNLIIDARPQAQELRTLRQLSAIAVIFAVLFAALGAYGIELRSAAPVHKAVQQSGTTAMLEFALP